MMRLIDALSLVAGAQLVGDGQRLFARVHTDTRSLQAGDLFVALKGERFDAHGFLSQAAAHGAVGAVAESGLREAGLPGLLVPDTRVALGQLAAGWRRRFDLPLIAVTGSNGKTTVTQMVASILRAWQGDGAFWTQGNFNNDVGVPLTLLRLRRDASAHHTAAVVELGMNHPGEIAHLAALSAPTVALVNNAQREHQEFMGTVEAVAHENGAVIAALSDDGVAVFPADDAYTSVWRQLAGQRRTMTFALQGGADVRAQAQWRSDGWQVNLETPFGSTQCVLRIAGWHNVKNALAATACALAAGCSLSAVAQGLSAFEPVKGRSQVKSCTAADGHTVTLVDDTYNANPDSVRAAIDVLADLPAPRWLILGDMAEVGDRGPAFHAEVGAYAHARGIDVVWTVGALAQHAAMACPGASHVAQTAEALLAQGRLGGESASGWMSKVASVLVKGSRFMKMEQVVDALMLRMAGRGGRDHAF